MKKLILFFGFLSAEEVKNDSSEPQLSDESTQKTALDTGLKQAETDDDFFHFQPTAGLGLGILSMLRLNANLDFYFNVKHTPYHNIYLGLGAGLYYAPMWENFLEIPVYGNFVVDFATGRSKVLKSVSLRVEAGCLTLYWQAHKSILGFEVKDTFFYWYIFGIGADLLFKQDFVLRIGLENGELIIPTFSAAVGYRF